MIELNDFERAIAGYIWPSLNAKSIMDGEIGREITRRCAAEILALAKKELMKSAMRGEVVNDDSLYQLIVPALGSVLHNMEEGERVNIIILKDDETNDS